MKIKLITGILMLLTLKLAAQKLPVLSDNILPGKLELQAQFTHYNPEKDSATNRFTKMPADTFIHKMDLFKAAANREIDQDKDEKRRVLKRGDLDYFIYNFRKFYMSYYGLDVEHRNHRQPGEKAQMLVQHNAEEKKKLGAIVTPDFDVNNEALFKVSAAYRHWLNGYVSAKEYKYPVDSALAAGSNYIATGQISKIKAVKSMVTNLFIKEYLIYQSTLLIIKSVKNPTAKEDAYRDFMALTTNIAYKNQIEQVYSNYKAMLTNPVAPDFSYLDANGKPVTLNSLRGQYVFVDFWATWCAPCKEQFPFLATLEKKYGEQMHFIGISIDRPEDKKKWETYVKSSKIGGIQVLADKGPNADFVKKFNVSGIPRFMIIDPEGKVVSSDAKAPSDPQLEVQLEALLKK